EPAQPVVGVGGRQRRLFSHGGGLGRPLFSPGEKRGARDGIPPRGLWGGGLPRGAPLHRPGVPPRGPPPPPPPPPPPTPPPRRRPQSPAGRLSEPQQGRRGSFLAAPVG